MGHVILPSGTTAWIDDLNGSINLSQLIEDMKCEDYTVSYRIAIIGALGKLGKAAQDALTYLRQLTEREQPNANAKHLADAAQAAIRKIEDGKAITVTRAGQNPRGPEYPSTWTGHQTGNVHFKKAEYHKVTFTEIEDTGGLHDGLRHYCRCNFCEKMTCVNSYHKEASDRLGGSNRFFCSFCLRNDYYQRYGNHVMVLTYRGIIGYYYYAYYVMPKVASMIVADIHDYLDLHQRAGLQNPLFRYDPETFCWFIDFSKVGKRKMPVEFVLKTIIQQLACFNLYENVRGSSPRKIYEKYQEAVLEFHQHRARINGDKVFAPTLWGCDLPSHCPAGTRSIPVDALKSFVHANMQEGTNRPVRGRV